jgi:hypothetical protein
MKNKQKKKNGVRFQVIATVSAIHFSLTKTRSLTLVAGRKSSHMQYGKSA